ncbi:MAG TPA: hypothetical protein VFE15_06995 [Marmoricola sp.]|jgi:hypothetical protein|nr:hypothetical protein [Marmoricola sp.]
MNGSEPTASTHPHDESRATIEALRRRVEHLETRRPRRPRRGQWLAATAVAVVAIVAVSFGVAGASPTNPTPPDLSQASYTPLPVVKKLYSGSIAANKTSAQVVARGGTSTVPSNSSAVQLSVTLKATKPGIFRVVVGEIYTPIIYSTGTVTGVVVDVAVGAGDKIAFMNGGPAAVTATVNAVGYTQQVADTDVYGDDVGTIYSTRGVGSGSPTTITAHTSKVVASLTVPIGAYEVSWTASLSGSTALCIVSDSEGGSAGAAQTGDTNSQSAAVTGVDVFVRGSGTISVTCQSESATDLQVAGGQSLVAVPQRHWIPS